MATDTAPVALNKKGQPKTSWLVNVSVPNQTISDAITEWAKGQPGDLSTGRAVLQLLASTVGFTIPASTGRGRRKYATKEAAQAASSKAMELRNNKIRVNMRMATCISKLIGSGADPMDIAKFSMAITSFTNDNDFDGAEEYMDIDYPETRVVVKPRAPRKPKDGEVVTEPVAE